MKKVGPRPGLDTESALIARDEHRQGGRGAAWLQQRDRHREEVIEQMRMSSVDKRMDSPLS